MLTKININQDFKKIDRILNGSIKNTFSLEFKEGINILTARNGSGKTTIMEALHELIITGNISGFRYETYYKEFTQPKNWMFFSMKDMTAQKQLASISPFDVEDFAERNAFWYERMELSHGQQMKEVLLDIEKMTENADVIFIDEPETALDLIEMVDFVKMLQRIKDTQIILISHHPILVFHEKFNIVEFYEGNTSYLELLKRKMKQVKLSF